MEIPFTKIVDFINAVGIDKLKCVREIIKMNQTDYSPIKDYYKVIRDYIIAYFKNPTEELPLPRRWPVNEVKRNLFLELFSKVKNHFGKKVEWIEGVENTQLPFEKFDIKINPDIFIKYKKEKFIIKLYFKREELEKKSADLLILLLKKSYENKNGDFIPGIYDIRNDKLITLKNVKINKDLEMTLNKEIELISSYITEIE